MNSLTMLDNNAFLADQKFGPGDGYLSAPPSPPSPVPASPSSVRLPS